MAEQLQRGGRWIEDQLTELLGELRGYLTDVQSNMYRNHGISLDAAGNAFKVTQKIQRLVESDLHQALIRRQEREEKASSIKKMEQRIASLEATNQQLHRELDTLSEQVRSLQSRLGDDEPISFPSSRRPS